MKTVLITAIFMSFCVGASHFLKVSNDAGARLEITTIANAEELIDRLGITKQTKQDKLGQELSESIQSLTQGIKQTVKATVDVAMTAVSYVFLSLAQTFAALILDR